jgi:ferrochelatase
MAKTAIVLFNLGGPDSPDAVRPFLFNLFHDPAIIRIPQPFRWLLAWFISTRRAPVAREIYGNIGGRSPLLPLTEEQAEALAGELTDLGDVRVFLSMRYWHPFSHETVEEVKAWQPDDVVMLPLYPQYSTTTTASSFRDWQRAAARFDAPTRAICCYPLEPEFIAAHVETVQAALDRVGTAHGTPRVLFSAHGLPKDIVDGGDPYQYQVEQTAGAVAEKLGLADGQWVVCYQSRVGPKEWIGPSTDAEIERAGRDGVPLVVTPIAFVSEHSETLVELDIEYRELAEKAGVPVYERVPALGTHPRFIKGLADTVRRTVGRTGTCSQAGGRTCPAAFSGCPLDPMPAGE